ncbi:hypothetical protein H0H92_014455 [Tricholoma furcatifolium]|nr:hypothetical protein H0H92_014455 [Tricholoma furcatifolium]
MSSQDSESSTALSGFYNWTDTLKGVYYGPGSTATALPKLLDKLSIKKALLVTGKSLHDKTDVVKKVQAILEEHNAYGTTFYEIGQHSPVAGIRRALDVFKQHQCDGIVAVGGGSPIDASKAMLYFHQKETGGATLCQIAIPTTLSAAEYSIGAGYTDDEGIKVAVSSQALAPAGIILDAELTLATPERLCKSIVHRNSPKVAIGIVDESLAHKVGEVQCLTLAPVVALKARTASREDKELLAKALFYLCQPSTGSVEGDVLKLSSLIHELVISLGLQSNLTEYNVPEEDLPKIAGAALDEQDDPNLNQAEVVDMLKTLY